MLASNDPVFVHSFENPGASITAISPANGDLILDIGRSHVERRSSEGDIIRSNTPTGSFYINDHAVGADDSTVIVGTFRGSVNFGEITLVADDYGMDEGFVAKIDRFGNFVWANKSVSWITYMHSVEVLSDGVITVAGTSKGLHTALGDFEFSMKDPNSDHGFVAQLDQSGAFTNVVKYTEVNAYFRMNASIFNGPELTQISGNRINLTGIYHAVWPATIGGRSVNHEYAEDTLFHIKFAPNLSVNSVIIGRDGNHANEAEIEGFYLGASSSPDGRSTITARFDCKVYATPFVFSNNGCFNPGDKSNATVLTPFVAHVGPSGQFGWAFKGPDGTRLNAAGLDDGSTLVGGYFEGTFHFLGRTLNSVGSADAFLARVSPDGVVTWLQQIGTNGVDVVGDIIYLGGYAYVSVTVGEPTNLGTLDLAAGSHFVKIDIDPKENNPPTLNSIPNANIPEDAGVQSVALSGITAGVGESQPLSVSVTSSNTALIPTPEISYTSPNTTGSLAFAPLSDKSGASVITVTVEDGGHDGKLSTYGDNNSFSRVFTVTVNAVNDTPTLAAISNRIINENAGLQTLNLSGITAGGGENQPLRVTAVSSNPSLIPNPAVNYSSANSIGSLNFSPNPNRSGVTTITVTVEDGGLDGNLATLSDNEKASRSFNVTVNEINDPPTLNEIGNLAIDEDSAAQTVSLSGISAGVGESQPLRVRASSSNKALIPDPTVTYTSAEATGTIKFTPVAAEFGVSTVTVTVEDGGLDGNLATAADNATFTRSFDVSVNVVPTLDALANLTIDENAAEQTVNLAGINAGGGESQPLRVMASSSNTGLIPDPTVTYTSAEATGTIKLAPIADQSGTATITVTVEDGGLDSDLATPGDNASFARTFDVVVNPINDAPTLDPISDLTIDEDAGRQKVALSGIADTDGYVPSSTATQWRVADGGNGHWYEIVSGSLKWSDARVAAEQSGGYLATLTSSGENDFAKTLVTGSTFLGGFQDLTSVDYSEPKGGWSWVTGETWEYEPWAPNNPDNSTYSNPAGENVLEIMGPSESFLWNDANELATIPYLIEYASPLRVSAITSDPALISDPVVTFTNHTPGGTLSFAPTEDAFGTATITVTVEDAGLDGEFATTEDNATFSRTFNVVVNPVNDIPILDPAASPALEPILEDSAGPSGAVGTLVSALIDSDGTHENFLDVDGDLPAIAITSVNLQGGSLWFSEDNGTTWNTLEAVSDAEPRLLFADAVSRLYFQPAPDFSGEINDVITFKAWDRNQLLQLGSDIDGEAAEDKSGESVSLSSDGQTVAIGATYNDGNGPNSGHVRVYRWTDSSWQQLGADIDGEAAEDFSRSVSLSSDGQTLAIGARNNDGNGDFSGHVRIYRWTDSSWQQLGADIDGEVAFDFSAYSVSLSSDGNTIAIGAHSNDGNGTNSGHVRIYDWNDSAWQQRGPDIDGEAESDFSGMSVSLSSDGNMVAIGATGNDGNGDFSGHVRIYRWTDSSWQQLGADIDGEAAGDNSGVSVSLSADGNTVAIGAISNDGNGPLSGHVRIYRWTDSSWQQLGADIDGEAADDRSGKSVSLSSDGQNVAIGALQNDGNGSNSGHVRIYRWIDSLWQQQGSDIDGAAGDFSGSSVSLSSDGQTIAIGAPGNDGNGSNSGHVRIYRLGPTVSIATDTVGIRVTPVNDDPTMDSISNLTVDEDAAEQTVNISGILAGGGEGQPLRVTAASSNTGLIPDPTITYTSPDNTGTIRFKPVANQFGVSTITVTVEDGGLDGDLATAGDNASFIRTFDVSVNTVNDTPTLDALSNLGISEDAGEQTVNLTGISSGGGESQPLRVTASSSNTGLIPDLTVTYTPAEATGTIKFTPVAAEFGVSTVTVTVEDGGLDGNLATAADNATFTRSFDVSVNVVPTLDALANLTIDEDAAEQTVNLAGITAGGRETQPLRVTAVSSNTGLIPGPTVTYTSAEATGTIKFTPVAAEFGVSTVTVTVEDGGLDGNLATTADNATFTRFFDVSVNVVPTLDGLENLTIEEDAAEQTVNLAGITAGAGETQSLKVTATSGNTGLILDPTVTYISANATGSLAFTLVPDQSGTATITVTVEDGGLDGDLVTPGDNASFARTFDVVVNPINDVPTLDTISNLAIDEDAAAQTVNLAGITSGGGEAQPLRVTAVSSNTALIANPAVTYTSANATGSLAFTPVADQSGTATITVTVEDGGLDGNLATTGDNASFARTFDVVVNSINDLPTLDGLGNLTIDEDAAEQTVNLAGITAGGGESQPLRVTATSGNTGLLADPSVIYTSANATGSLAFTPVADQSGTATITVTVEDGGLDGDLATPRDNGSFSQEFVVQVGRSSFDAFDGVLRLDVREKSQQVTITASNSGLIFELQDGTWFGVDVAGISGNGTSRVEIPDATVFSRMELIGRDTGQALVFADPGQWQMGPWASNVAGSLRSVETPDDDSLKVHLDWPRPWQNAINASDVNNDRATTALDALQIINELSRGTYTDPSTGLLRSPAQLEPWPGIYYDQNGDGRATALDALRVINDLARGNVSGEGEAVTADYLSPMSADIWSLGTERDEEYFESEFEKAELLYSDADIETFDSPELPEDLVYATVGQESTEAVDSLLSDVEDWWKQSTGSKIDGDG